MAVSYNFFTALWRRVLSAAFDTATGHDHDGVNSKAVTTGTPSAGALAATTGGRAIMANDYFDAATLLAKVDLNAFTEAVVNGLFAADCIDNAELLKLIKNGAFVADAATLALFADYLWTGAKIANYTITPNKFDRGTMVSLYEDFIGPAGQTLPAPWKTQDTSAGGSPTLDYVTAGIGGTYVLKLATTTEAEAITLYNGDNVWIDITKAPVIEWRAKLEPDVTGAGGALGASDIIVMGLASARNATLDNIATNAWFRLEGANANILIETDDGTTDNDDNDSTADWVAGTYYTFKIDCSTLASIKFYINGVDKTPETMSLAAATGGVQVFFEVTKASAANKDHRLTIDYVKVDYTR